MSLTKALIQQILAQHVILLGKTRSGKSSVMRAQFVEPLLTEHEPLCIIDPKGDWWGLKSSADGKKPGFPIVIFGGEHADVKINERSGAPIAELFVTGNLPCLIDLGGWMVGERTRFFIDFASTLFKINKGNRHLAIDEVHNFAPQGKVLDPDAGKMLHWANRLASEGLGRGINLLCASQRSQKVHKDFVTSCETLIAMKVIHKLDRDAIKDWIDGCADPAIGKEVLATLAQLKRGEGWIWSPEADFGPERMQFPFFKTFDSFKPQSASRQGTLKHADIDLGEIQTKLASVIEEQKSNDPKELRRQLNELRKQLHDQRGEERHSEDELTRALSDGHQAGYQEGFNAGANHAYAKGWQEFRAAVTSSIESLPWDPPMLGEVFTPVKTPVLPREKLPLRQALQEMSKPAPVNKNTLVDLSRPINGSSDGKLSKAERKILTVLAQYPSGRTKSQVAVVSGYASTGGGFNNALSSLRTKAYISGMDSMSITQEGLHALGDYEPLPHGRDLLNHWLNQLSKAEKAILTTLTKHYPNWLTKEQIAQQAGYEATGGGFNNALSRLRTLELIEGMREMKASDSFYR